MRNLKAFWALGNISGDNNLKFRDALFKMNVFQMAINFLEKRSDTQYHFKAALRHAVWLLSNLCRDKPPENYQITYKAFPVFSMIIDKIYNDISVFMDSAYAMKQMVLIYLSNFFFVSSFFFFLLIIFFFFSNFFFFLFNWNSFVFY